MQVATTADQPRSLPHDAIEPRQRRSAQCDLVLAQRKEKSPRPNEKFGGSIASISNWLDQRLRNPIPHVADTPPLHTDARKRVPPDSLAISRGAVLRAAFAKAATNPTSGFGSTNRSESWSQAREYNGQEDHDRGESFGAGGRHREAQVHGHP